MTPSTPTEPKSVAERVLDTIAVTLDLPRESLHLDSRIEEDLQADSLDVLSLIMALEDEFQGSVDRSEVDRLKTVGDIVRHVERTLA